MDILFFPINDGSVKSTYYEAYYMSVVRSAKFINMSVIFTLNEKVWCGKGVNAYSCVLNDKQLIMDFSDHTPLQLNPADFKSPYFKWHYSLEVSGYPANVHPLCVLQDYDYEEYQRIQTQVNYTANGELITNNQRCVAGAKERRALAQRRLLKAYGANASVAVIPQKNWWLSHNDCLVSVAVPGARNDMLDRGQMELMGLGVCVVSPVIVTVLAGGRTLEPFKHFVPVEGTYNNLIDMIEWCRKHRSECVEIGKNAKLLYDEVATPQRYWSHIKEVLDAK